MKKITNKLSGRKNLFDTVAGLIEQSRKKVAVTVNTELVWLNWNIETAIRKNILGNKRAGYGEEVVGNLSQQLTEKYGSGWSQRQLWNCVRTAFTIELDPYQEVAVY